MKFTAALSSATLLMVSSAVWAEQAAYYDVEEIALTDTSYADYNYGPYPAAISEDGSLIGSYSMKASLSQDIDIGLPFTFNRACQYDDELCELEFYGSEAASDLSYDNAYQAWRNAQSDAQYDGYVSYMMGSTFATDAGTDTAIIPFDESYNDTDVKVTDVFISAAGDKIVIGYSSAAYDSSNQRDFVRRAFIYNQTQGVMNSLLPEFYEETGNDDADDANGGFSSAYKIKQVGEKILVVGAGSISLPEDDDADDVQEYFQNCYFSDESDEIATLNELLYCPGFDTQAWAWDVTDYLTETASGEGISGFALATEWLDDNQDNDNSDITYSASALDINESGIAVGVSTFEYSDAATGGRQRAIIMTPDSEGNYAAPTELTAAVDDVEDDAGDTIYNSWAVGISDTNIVIGNREYSVSKAINKPTEFFVYDIDNDSILFPLQDIKVLTTEQQNNGESSAKTGANSQAYAINASGFIVGKADDYDQTHAVTGGKPRTQSAFLYDNNSDKSWFINDLICTADDEGAVTSPRYKIRSARAINDDGTVLAEGWKYDTDADYQNETNATEVMLKLTHDADSNAATPDDSPNCWQSDLLATEDNSYERSAGASLWLWILALPLLLMRRLSK